MDEYSFRWLWWPNDTQGQMWPKYPDICLTGEENPEKITQETCPDQESNLGMLQDRHTCYRLLHSSGCYLILIEKIMTTLWHKGVGLNDSFFFISCLNFPAFHSLGDLIISLINWNTDIETRGSVSYSPWASDHLCTHRNNWITLFYNIVTFWMPEIVLCLSKLSKSVDSFCIKHDLEWY